jgi:hypothetical protein
MTRGRVKGTAGTLALAFVMAVALPAPAAAQESEKVRAAKALTLDRRYAEARKAWEAVRAGSTGADAEAAAYWIARSSEGLQENDRALREYDAYLALRPRDRALAEEARTSRVTIAVRLYKAGQKDRAATLLKDALFDSSKTVRYYAALQMGGLGPVAGKPAIPVLRKILAEETDPDLVDRAKLALLRLEPAALPRETPSARTSSARTVRWMRVKIFKPGEQRPKVQINLPLGLAELLFKALPEDALEDLRREGYDAATFWERLRALGPSEIIDIVGEDGERIQIWTE